MLFSRVSQGEHFELVINNPCLPDEVLTVKDDKEEPFSYMQPKVGLSCAYVNFQETNKYNKITNMCLKLILQVII